MATPALSFLSDTTELPRDHVALVGTFPFRPTMFLGLGGTGSQAVAKQKELFLKLVKPQMHAGIDARIADISPLYAFCAFDTNATERPRELDAGTEWHHLTVEDMADFYENKGKTPFYEPWLLKHFPVTSLGAGACGFRNLGRLAFIYNASSINTALSHAREQIIEAAAGINVVTAVPLVHVFCSLSGGTGSGMLLDTCFLLRHLMPGVRIIGHIAVLDELPQLTEAAKRRMKVNTYCALKELNAFMSSGVPEGLDKHIPYSAAISADATFPFDYCFLLGTYRGDGSKSLPEQKHLSSFMARVAFMVSGYSFRPDDQNNTPDFLGVMVNNAVRLTEVEGGARACYLVSGFAQAHFPVQDTATLFTCIKARECLEYLRGGTGKEGNHEAANFFAQHALDSVSITDAIGHDTTDDQHPLLGSPTYDKPLTQLFENPYDHREEILSFANAIPSARLAEILTVLRPNLDALRDRIQPAIHDTAAAYFENDEYLGLGVDDFLRDLKMLVDTEYNLLQKNAAESVDADYADLPRKWNSLQSQVTDAVTCTGVTDRVHDWYSRTEVRTLYTEYLNRAEAVLLQKARTDLAKEFYTNLSSRIGALQTAFNKLRTHDIPDAIKEFEKNELIYNTSLYAQDNAEESSVEHVRSFNVMTNEWRKTYLKERSLPPSSILNNLVRSGWRPVDLLDLRPAEGISVGKEIARILYNRVSPLFDEVRRWTPVDVLRNSANAMRVTPAELIAKIYSSLLQPQMQVAGMKSRTNIDLDTIIFSGGITEDFKAELSASGKFGNIKFNVADNQETGRINFTSITLPVALAGCDLAWKTLESHYNSWLNDVQKESARDREDQIAQYHCFPGSANWPSPVRYSAGHDATKELFARALTVSEILEPTKEDLDKMNATSKSPKDKRYSLFQVGDSAFWICPFFTPGDSSARIPGVPVNLGANVIEAFDKLAKSRDLQQHARQWVEWMEEHWSDEHSSKDIVDMRNKALLSFATRKGRTNNQAWRDLWDEISGITRDWAIG